MTDRPRTPSPDTVLHQITAELPAHYRPHQGTQYCACGAWAHDMGAHRADIVTRIVQPAIDQRDSTISTLEQRLAALREVARGYYPACGWTSLFLGAGGYTTCARLDCPNPCAADQMLHGSDNLDAPWQPQADGSWTLNINEGGGILTVPRQTTMRERAQLAAAWSATRTTPTPSATPKPVPCPACRRADQAGLAPSEQHDDCVKEQR